MFRCVDMHVELAYPFDIVICLDSCVVVHNYHSYRYLHWVVQENQQKNPCCRPLQLLPQLLGGEGGRGLSRRGFLIGNTVIALDLRTLDWGDTPVQKRTHHQFSLGQEEVAVESWWVGR